jgi:primosomal protein N' (replication factor Y)
MLSNNNNSLAKRNEFLLTLTEEQQQVVDRIKIAIDKNEFQPFLLHGVTGSGKTLVYIHIIQHCLTIGKTTLILVPEISLTPQLIDRFNLVFPNQIALIHSRLSDGERYDA